MRHIVILSFTLLLPIKNSSAESAPPFVQPVSIVQRGSQVLVSFRPICGSDFRGILVAEGKDHIKLGAVFVNPHHPCLSLPPPKIIELTRFLRSEKPFISTPLISQHLAINPVENTFLHKGRLYSNYHANCSKGLGQIILPEGKGIIKISVLTRKVKEHCQTTTLTIHSSAISSKVRVAEPLDSRAKPYKVILAPIKPNSISHFGDSTHFKYLRYCHDAPIGLVRWQRRFAVLIARYPKSICLNGKSRRFLAHFKTHLFPGKIRRDTVFTAGIKQKELSLISPKAISRNSSQVKFDVNFGCSKYRGAVFYEGYKSLKVSFLGLRKVSRCQTKPRKISLSLPDRLLPAKVIGPLHLI